MFEENDHGALVSIVCESRLLRKTYPNVCSTEIILKCGSACDQSYMEWKHYSEWNGNLGQCQFTRGRLL